MTSMFPIILVRSLENINHFCPEAEGNCASGHIGARNYIVQLPTSTLLTLTQPTVVDERFDK